MRDLLRRRREELEDTFNSGFGDQAGMFEVLEPRVLLSGTSYVVDSLLDVVADDGVVTLREAIEAANTNAAVFDAAGGVDGEVDVITFSQGLAGGTIYLEESNLRLRGMVNIVGFADDPLTIKAAADRRVITVIGEDAEVELFGLNITGGRIKYNGGGIYNDEGTLTLRNVVVTGNSVIGYEDRGGGVYNSRGTLNVIDSAITGNASSDRGGGVYSYLGTMFVSDSTISNNSSWTSGGGIYSAGGELTVYNSIFTNNKSVVYGGGIWGGELEVVNSIFIGNSSSRGGAVNEGNFLSTFTNTVIVNNYASEQGGGINSSSGVYLYNSIVAMNDAGKYDDIEAKSINSYGSLVRVKPKFMRNPSAGKDKVWGTSDDDYGDLRLQSTSPGVNGGDNSRLPVDEYDIDGDGDFEELLPIDFLGEARVIDGVVDIGVYENIFANDLVAEIVNPKLPADVVSGDGTKISLPVEVTNQGNLAVAKSKKIDLAVYVRPIDAIDDSQDVLVASVVNQSVSGLKPGAVKKVKVSVYLPAGLAGDEYVFVVEVDSSNVVIESDEENNSALSSSDDAIAVTLGEVDLSGEFYKIKLASAMVSGQGSKGKVSLIVSNIGNVSVARNQRINVDIYLRQAGGGDVLIGSAVNQSLSKLRSGKSKKLNVNVVVSGQLPEGEYELVAVIDSSNAVTNERSEDNNELVGENTFICAPPFVDFTAEIVNPKLPDDMISGNGTRITLPVVVTNRGNVPIERSQKINLAVYARPQDAVDASQDVLVTTLNGQSVSSLKPGAVKKVNMKVYLPAGLAADEYVLVAEVDSSNAVAESNEINNTAITIIEDSINVDRGFIAFEAAVSSKAKLPGLLLAGDGSKFSMPVVVTNTGNVSTASNTTVDIVVVVRQVGGGLDDDVVLKTIENVKVGSLKPGRSKSLKLSNIYNTAAGLSGSYELVAKIEANVDTDTPAVEASSTPIMFVTGMMDMTMFNVDGVKRKYVNKKEVVESEVKSFDNGIYPVWYSSEEDESSSESHWGENDLGMFLNERVVHSYERGNRVKMELTFGDIYVAPAGLQINEKYSDTSAGMMVFEFYDLDETVTLSLNVNVTSKLSGYDRITTALGTFDVAKFTMTFKYDASGTFHGFTTKFKMSETIEIYASPEVGIVKMKEKYSLRLSVPGQFSASGSGGSSSELQAVLGLPV